MYHYKGKRGTFPWKLLLAWLPPVLMTGAFYLLRNNTALMTIWVHHIMAPVMQTVGRFWGLFPFAVGEAWAALTIAALILWVLWAILRLVRDREGRPFLRRILAAACFLFWLWGLFCWLWNCSYYAADFSQRAGLRDDPTAPEQLAMVTVFFAQQAAALSDDVPRDEMGRFAADEDTYFQNGPAVYDNLSRIYPELKLDSGPAKKLLFSRFQSILGFTGVYFPFTGEANVNVDAPACLVPATIAHEMSHQRMVAAEEEANFVGILACITSEDVVYQYSGYLSGLTHLANALNDLSPELLQTIMAEIFTEELRTDWNENYHYWKELDSSTQDKATEVYDGFLKHNGQSLGLLSYGACVDLLVNYFTTPAA